jgi:hypothetical protein
VFHDRVLCLTKWQGRHSQITLSGCLGQPAIRARLRVKMAPPLVDIGVGPAARPTPSLWAEISVRLSVGPGMGIPAVSAPRVIVGKPWRLAASATGSNGASHGYEKGSGPPSLQEPGPPRTPGKGEAKPGDGLVPPAADRAVVLLVALIRFELPAGSKARIPHVQADRAFASDFDSCRIG